MRALKLSMVSILLFATAACVTTNEVTGRNQFIMIPASQDAALGLEAMTKVRETAPIVETGPLAEKIKRIGDRIAAISDRPELDWEFVLIDEPVLNAWALPGGKVAVYKKMAEAFEDEAELAAILGHEVSHAVLRHGAEQVSRGQMQNIAVAGLGVIVGSTTDDPEIAQAALVLGSVAAAGFVQMPHSRSMELEADDIGTLYMARAGYDPRAAVRVWQKMKQMKEGQGGQPTFLSTHPSDDKRIDRLQAKMDVYLAEYRKARR
ncbi:peptidase M48 [Kordiimonas sediminis]|uniref:Peptidase M48 n=1 Tax=Kordiimonas sediminis TaxID=1735581 RepID=A0A919AU63_9PROT|nr:M48 family metallopeptidase [Kordiimonas sediminis]GHF23232.1 peptidase M48 [Kordiimonas sediminis]